MCSSNVLFTVYPFPNMSHYAHKNTTVPCSIASFLSSRTNRDVSSKLFWRWAPSAQSFGQLPWIRPSPAWPSRGCHQRASLQNCSCELMPCHRIMLLQVAQSFTLNDSALYLQMKKAVQTKVTLDPVKIHMKYSTSHRIHCHSPAAKILLPLFF